MNRPGFIPIFLIVLAGGCASALRVTNEDVDLTRHSDIVGKAPVILAHPILLVRQAALQVLGNLRAAMRNEGSGYLVGKLMSGEIVEVFLESDGDTRTRVWVDTDLTYGGIVWQQDRSADLLREIVKTLDREAMLPR